VFICVSSSDGAAACCRQPARRHAKGLTKGR
jgi:hypothetical protein